MRVSLCDRVQCGLLLMLYCFSFNKEIYEKCVTLEEELARQRGRPNKTWKEAVDKDVNDLQLKSSDAMNRSKWREMIRGNWSDNNRNSDVDN